MFFKTFAKTVRNTKNRSIRIVFQYKSTIKPVILCELYCEKHSNITKKVNGENNDLRCPPARRLGKTTNFPRSIISSLLMLGFPLLKLSSIP